MFNEFRPPERDPDRVIGSTEIPPPHDCADVDETPIPVETEPIEAFLPD